ncbi:MAG: CDP-diacylglycerol--serine O-phosphatidyltransferase [Pseudohongiellaceae bacterium]|jgi:CDP-diacylglycerol---serine O-phosphatidyltransferase
MTEDSNSGEQPTDSHNELPADNALIDEHEEVVSQNGKQVRRKGIYLLPNLLTTGALFAGFYAVIAGMGGDFHSACIASVVAMFFDGMDGRVARLTNTQSAFGAEFDSLSDMLAFGVAPALISFSWALSGLGKIGWTVAFIYVACAALRLARFNVQRASADKRFFVGLASPSAAGLVVFMVWAFSSFGVEVTMPMSIVAAVVTGIAGVLMVVNVRYYSFKELDFKNPVPFFLTLVTVFVIVVVSWDPPTMLFLMAVTYAASGPLMAIYLKRRKPRTAGAPPSSTT